MDMLYDTFPFLADENLGAFQVFADRGTGSVVAPAHRRAQRLVDLDGPLFGSDFRLHIIFNKDISCF